MQTISSPLFFALCNAGRSNIIKIAMIAMITNNSTMEKPCSLPDFVPLSDITLSGDAVKLISPNRFRVGETHKKLARFPDSIQRFPVE